MTIARFGSYWLGLFIVASSLAGCGTPQQMQSGIPQAGAPSSSTSGAKTFYYTGKAQKFEVPAGVTSVTVVARGGGGATSKRLYVHGSDGGNGGRVYAVLPVTPGEKMLVFVGGAGSGSKGGFNGGANGGGGVAPDSYCPRSDGRGGGGSSDLRVGGDKLGDRILVAAGGGGSGGIGSDSGSGFPPGPGGKGGGTSGGNGGNASGGGGSGGSQTAGGPGGDGGGGIYPSDNGDPGRAGSLHHGGAGGLASGYSGCDGGGGGGGGGYYGGGGGGGAGGWPSEGLSAAGGGGGSSYVEPSAIKSRTWTGWKNARGNGLIVISWK